MHGLKRDRRGDRPSAGARMSGSRVHGDRGECRERDAVHAEVDQMASRRASGVRARARGPRRPRRSPSSARSARVRSPCRSARQSRHPRRASVRWRAGQVRRSRPPIPRPRGPARAPGRSVRCARPRRRAGRPTRRGRSSGRSTSGGRGRRLHAVRRATRTRRRDQHAKDECARARVSVHRGHDAPVHGVDAAAERPHPHGERERIALDRFRTARRDRRRQGYRRREWSRARLRASRET